MKKEYKRIYEEFKKIGRGLWEANLNNSHSGNMSVKIADKVLITRRGSMLGFLKDEDIIEVGLKENTSGIVLASTEVDVHRAIYNKTSAQAVIHTHPKYTVGVSLISDEIIPIDVEGSYFFKKIPVLEFEYASGSEELREGVSEALRDYKIVVVKGHGAFSRGNTLEECFFYSTSLEDISKIIFLVKAMGYNPKNFEKDYFKKW
jgi:L-fuculose-phosphate aldolase